MHLKKPKEQLQIEATAASAPSNAKRKQQQPSTTIGLGGIKTTAAISKLVSNGNSPLLPTKQKSCIKPNNVVCQQARLVNVLATSQLT